MSASEIVAASVMFAPGLDVSDWERRYLAGTVPSRWPYGLDRLDAHGIDLSVIPFGLPSIQPIEHEMVRTTFGFDERVAQTLARGTWSGSRACGVIWLFTRPRGPRSVVARIRTAVALRGFDLVWCYSSAMVAPLERRLLLDPSRVAYVPLGIDAEFYSGAPYPPEPMILSVGNDRSRDTRGLYRALAAVHESHPLTRIVVQTNDDHPAPSFIERHARFRDHGELRDYYAQASVVIINTRPNLYTSGSTVALEAQAMGRPVVISDTPGMADYVVDGETGFRVSPGDESSFADAVRRLLDDRRLSESFGITGRRRVLAHHTTDTMAEHLSAALSAVSRR